MSNNQEISSAKRVAVAERIARDIINADSTILSLMVLDHLQSSRVLAVARSANLPPEEHANPALVQKLAIAAMVVWGAAEGAAHLMGKREFIIGAFKQQMVLLIDLREYEMLLAIRLNRSSNAEHLFAKIAGLLGMS